MKSQSPHGHNFDNDLDATQNTAVACAVDALDRLHSTAQSHIRVMVLEVIGRYAGWIRKVNLS